MDSEIFGYVYDLALISEIEEALQKFIEVWDEVLTAKGKGNDDK